MNIGKFILAVFSAALLLAANLRIVYAVSVSGEALPGTFSAAQLEAGATAAGAAAEEIIRDGGGDISGYAKRPKMTLSPPDGVTSELASALLRNTDGVATAWKVSVGGSEVGNVNDPTALGEVLEAILAEGAVQEAVAAGFANEITLRSVFVPEGSHYDLMALARALRGVTEVMSVTSDGTVRYG